MPTRIAAHQKANAAITTLSYRRTKLMRRKRVIQASLLSMSLVFLTVWAGGQSTQGSATPSPATGSSLAVPTEQQEMRDALKALRAEVERLRSEVKQQKSAARADDHANDRSGMVLAPIDLGPNVPSGTSSSASTSAV